MRLASSRQRDRDDRRSRRFGPVVAGPPRRRGERARLAEPTLLPPARSATRASPSGRRGRPPRFASSGVDRCRAVRFGGRADGACRSFSGPAAVGAVDRAVDHPRRARRVTERPLALGLVGCGRLAELGYLPALSLSRRVHLVAAADPSPTRRAELAAKASRDGIDRIATYPDAQRMIDEAPLDGVVLATPADAHVADARRAAAAGLAVLVEKPPAIDADGAAELLALSPTPWIGFNRRFDQGAELVRRAVPSTGEVTVGIGISYRRQ
ncbi:MAG: hypothetical protein EHM63_05005, partial [Actinobacteria bacterium]